MQEILNKYYDFFIKSNFTNKDVIKDDTEFYELYKLITNQYDLSKDKDLKGDLLVFNDFFNSTSISGLRRTGMYSLSDGGEERKKANFERRERVSFNWFKASKNMVKNNSFIHSIKRTENNFCKVYLSIKPEKYIDIMIKIQEFVDMLYTNHPDEELGECKFRKIPAMMLLF